MRNRQAGIALLELILAISILSVLLAGWNVWMQRQQQIHAAELLGQRLSDYNDAVARRLADAGLAMPSGTFTGVAWLQETGVCAGATAPHRYLSCDYPAQWRFRLAPRTVVVNSGTDLTATTTLVAAGTDTARLPDPGGLENVVLALRAVHHASERISSSTLLQTFDVWPAGLAPRPTEIRAVATTIGTTVDLFLRLDGSNAMTADIDVGGHSITNLEDVITTTGQQLGAVPFFGDITIGDRVTKWNCPPGMVPAMQVSGIPQMVPALTTPPLVSWQLYFNDLGTQFELTGQVVTATGAVASPHTLRVAVIGQCV